MNPNIANTTTLLPPVLRASLDAGGLIAVAFPGEFVLVGVLGPEVSSPKAAAYQSNLVRTRNTTICSVTLKASNVLSAVGLTAKTIPFLQ